MDIVSANQPLPPAKDLSQDEEFLLKKCENIIRIGLATFVEVGLALKEIQDGRLYRRTDPTFEEYLQRVMGLSRPYAYNLIESAKLMKELRASADLDKASLPKNEAQARELVRISPDKRVDVWKKVVNLAEGKPLTAKMIREVARHERFSGATRLNGAEIAVDKVKRLRGLFENTKVAKDAFQLIERLEQLALSIEMK